jgi:hypothetical protein
MQKQRAGILSGFLIIESLVKGVSIDSLEIQRTEGGNFLTRHSRKLCIHRSTYVEWGGEGGKGGVVSGVEED